MVGYNHLTLIDWDWGKQCVLFTRNCRFCPRWSPMSWAWDTKSKPEMKLQAVSITTYRTMATYWPHQCGTGDQKENNWLYNHSWCLTNVGCIKLKTESSHCKHWACAKNTLNSDYNLFMIKNGLATLIIAMTSGCAMLILPHAAQTNQKYHIF